MVSFLKFIWQLPQNIVSLLYYLYLHFRGQILDIYIYKDVIAIVKSTPGSVTLGENIFLSHRASEVTEKHEYGHTRQSLVLGPLYLIIIGLPSILWAMLHNYIAPNKSYYWFYTEKLADKLGKVTR